MPRSLHHSGRAAILTSQVERPYGDMKQLVQDGSMMVLTMVPGNHLAVREIKNQAWREPWKHHASSA